MTVTPRMPATITLPVGRILIVRATADSRGSVWKLPEVPFGKRSIVGWAEPDAPFQAGPFPQTRTFKIVAMAGELEFETKEMIVVQLERATERIRSATVIAKALNEGREAMSQEMETALEKVDAAAAPVRRAPAPGSFAASIRAMMDEAREGITQARAEGLGRVQEAVAKLGEAKVATAQVTKHMAKTIADEAADVMAELGQLSNMPPE